MKTGNGLACYFITESDDARKVLKNVDLKVLAVAEMLTNNHMLIFLQHPVDPLASVPWRTQSISRESIDC